MKIRAIIVDDEQPARDELRYLLSSHGDIEIIGEADSASSAIRIIRKKGPEVVFLDIEMPGKSGFDLIAELSDMEHLPLFVFATAYDNYAVAAFEKSAIDYILKPLSEERLRLTVERIRQSLQQGNRHLEKRLKSLLSQVSAPAGKPKKVSVEKDGRMQLINPEDIIYCSYESGRILISTRHASYPLYGIATMDKLADHLQGSSFFRAHRSLLVNLDQISEFSPWFNGKYNIVMNDDKRSALSISRARVKEFKQELGI